MLKDGQRFISQQDKRARSKPAVLSPEIVINIDEKYQLRHWAKQFCISDDELRTAVEQVGPSAEKVRQYVLGLEGGDLSATL